MGKVAQTRQGPPGIVRRAFGIPRANGEEDMTLTRWKLMAGLLGLSMGGVAATADPPCRVVAAGPPGPAPCPVVVAVPEVSCPTGPQVAVGTPIIPVYAVAPPGATPPPAAKPTDPPKVAAEPAPPP